MRQQNGSCFAKNNSFSVNGTEYPKLAKKSSDGVYCYGVQRRLSSCITALWVRLGISANTATLVDFIFAIVAALFLYLGYPIAAVVFIQLFGIWSCVDGEVARLTKETSQLGDYYDTMVDRTGELLIVGALMVLMERTSPASFWGTLFFAYMGSVFLITASSEKFRSVFRKNYPKIEQEPFFCWLCAGSDIRFLHLSLGIIAYALSGYTVIIQWLMVSLTVLLGLNLIFRLWRIVKLVQEERPRSKP